MRHCEYTLADAQEDIARLRRGWRRRGRVDPLRLDGALNAALYRLGRLSADDLAELMDWLAIPQPEAPKVELRRPERWEKSIRLYAVRGWLKKRAEKALETDAINLPRERD